MSRHHILPPVIYSPPPPKPKETKRKRGVGYASATEATGEADETGIGGGGCHQAANMRNRSSIALTCSGTSNWWKCPEPTVWPVIACGQS